MARSSDLTDDAHSTRGGESAGAEVAVRAAERAPAACAESLGGGKIVDGRVDGIQSGGGIARGRAIDDGIDQPPQRQDQLGRGGGMCLSIHSSRVPHLDAGVTMPLL